MIKLRVHNGGIVMVDAVLIINAYRVPDLPKSNPVIAVVSVLGWQISSLADLNYILQSINNSCQLYMHTILRM